MRAKAASRATILRRNREGQCRSNRAAWPSPATWKPKLLVAARSAMPCARSTSASASIVANATSAA
eukprot:12306751-Prorocentrum_lima.AAC.1